MLPEIDFQPHLRYTVERAILPSDDTGDRRCYLILDEGIPYAEINRHLLHAQSGQARPVSTNAYYLCGFLNYLDHNGLSVGTMTRNDIYLYLSHERLAHSKKYTTLRSTLSAIASLCESLARRNIPLDQSLYLRTPHSVRVKRSKRTYITNVWDLITEFRPGRGEKVHSTYTKWYSPEEILAISDELAPTYRCIFWCTVLLGYRVDSALSVTMSTISLAKGLIEPTRSKTNRTHVSPMAPMLREMIGTYIVDVRSEIVSKTGSTSPYLFLSRKGTPVTYAAYRSALIRAGERAKAKNPELSLHALHTHAGRSTFAATLRSYQLACRRKGLKTFSDDDFCTLMDWSSTQCLPHYDLVTRAQEVSPLLVDFFQQYFDIASANRSVADIPKERIP